MRPIFDRLISIVAIFVCLLSCSKVSPPIIFSNSTDASKTAVFPAPQIPAEYSCVPSHNKREMAFVKKVIDGDSILVEMNSELIEIRYVGINAPEFDGPQERAAQIAMETNRNLVLGKTIWMVRDVRDKDKYHRLLRFVFVGDLFVNLELVKQGVAQVQDYPPDTSCQTLFRKYAP